jgi:hypothetical protein
MSEQPDNSGSGGGVERKGGGGGGVGDALKVMFRTKRNSHVVRRSSSSSIRSNSTTNNNTINASLRSTTSSSVQDSWRTSRTYSGDDSRNFSYSIQQQKQQHQKLESKKKSEIKNNNNNISGSINSVDSSVKDNNTQQNQQQHQQQQHQWDLKTCIDTIESLLENDTMRSTLSEDQKAAIGNLRTISTSTSSSQRQLKRSSRPKLDSLLKRLSGGGGSGKHYGPFSIQSPFFSSTSSSSTNANNNNNNLLSSLRKQKSIFMTEELQRTWIEVSNDNNDTDRQQCVHDVIEHFGGTHYDPVWGGNINDVVPQTLRKMTYGKSVRRSGVGHAGMSTLLTEFNDGSGSSAELMPPNSSSSVVSFSSSLCTDIGTGGTTTESTSKRSRQQLKIINYCPPEWNRLTIDAKTELTSLLSLENLSRWDFDVFTVADLSRVTLLTTSSSSHSISMREECDEEEHKQRGVCEEEEEEEEEEEKHKQQQGDDGNCTNTKIEQFCPLLFIGWAILCAPMAQHSMEGSLEGYASTRDPSYYRLGAENGDDDNDDNRSSSSNNFHYHFDDHLKINPESICNFLREIETRYSATTPYHNNTHAADVTQTLHCLLASIGKDLLYSISKPLEIFSLILAATFHDVGHPGTNNLFHKNAMTSFALQFNDVSILENMHSAVGHSLLMGDEKKDEWDVFKGWDRSQIVSARGIMIRAILGTDMSNHFFKMDELMEKIESVRFTANIVLQSELGEDEMEDGEGGGAGGETKMRSRDEKDQQLLLDMLANTQSNTRRLSRDEGKFQQHSILELLAQMLAKPIPNSVGSDKESSKTYAELKAECVGLSSQILVFLLHAADISNPTKPQKICVRWAHNALNEFFAQGEKEKELSLPVSPLCDKQTTKTADSQIGFLQFVVRPAYVLLGDIVPKVKEELLPIIDENLEYWKTMKRRESFQKKQEQLK